VVDAARRFSTINMPLDFFAQSNIGHGEVNWVSTDGDSIDLRVHSENWTEEENSAGIFKESMLMTKLFELTKYIKWIAIVLIALTATTLLKG
jgi:hypothetical protein